MNTPNLTTITINDPSFLQPSKYDIIQARITTTIFINLSIRHRPARDNTATILLHHRKQPQASVRIMVNLIAKQKG